MNTEVVPFLIRNIVDLILADEVDEIGFVFKWSFGLNGLYLDDIVIAVFGEVKIALGAKVEEGGDDVFFVFDGGVAKERSDADAEIVGEFFVILIGIGFLDDFLLAMNIVVGANSTND